KAYLIHFNMGEIDFFRLQNNGDAATHYMAAARGIPAAEAQNGELAQLRHDALFNAIAALQIEAGKGKPGQAETETDKKFAEALELYAQLYPTDPALPGLFFAQGKFYYDRQVYDPAVKIWG